MPPYLVNSSTATSPRHRRSISERQSYHSEGHESNKQNVSESELQPQDKMYDASSIWESNGETYPRQSLQDVTTKPANSGTDSFQTTAQFGSPHTLSRRSIDEAFARQSAGRNSLNPTSDETSTRHATDFFTPRNISPETVLHPSFGSGGRQSDAERHSQSPGEPASAHPSGEINQGDGYAGTEFVIQPAYVSIKDGNGPVGYADVTEYPLGAPHPRHLDDSNEVYEAVMEDADEEEGNIFLIKDYINPISGVAGGEIGAIPPAQVPLGFPLPSDPDARYMDKQMYTGRENLDFSFSYGEATASHLGTGDNTSSMSHALSDRENFSFSAPVVHSPHSRDVHAIAALTSEMQLASAPMLVEDLDTLQPDIADGVNDNSDAISFSDRVYREVASMEAGDAYEHANKEELHENNIQGELPSAREADQCANIVDESLRPSMAMPICASNLPTGYVMLQNGNYLEHHHLQTRIQQYSHDAMAVSTQTPINSAPIPAPDSLRMQPPEYLPSPISPPEKTTHNEDFIRKFTPIDPSSYLTSSPSTSNGMMSTPKEGGSAKYAFTSPVGTASMQIVPDHEPLHMTNFYSSIMRDNRRHDGVMSPYHEISSVFREQGATSRAKRIKLTTGKAATPGDKMSPDWMAIGDTVTGDAYRLVHTVLHSIKVLIGAKLSGKGYEQNPPTNDISRGDDLGHKTTDFQTLSKSLFQSSTPHRKVYEDTKALVAEMIEKLKRINSIKEQLDHECCSIANKGSVMLHKGREAYCSLVRSTRRIAKAIEESEAVVSLQQKLMHAKAERLAFLKCKVTKLLRCNQLYTALAPKLEHLDRLVSALANAYTATGIRVVPVSTEKQQMLWCFVVSFNSDINMRRSVRRFRRTWHNDLARLADKAIDTLLHRPFEYHRVKLDHRFNPEIKMLVYLRPSNEHLSNGIQAKNSHSVGRLYDDSPGYYATPRDRSYVPAFRSHELPSNGSASFMSPFGSNHAICSINGLQAEAAAGFYGTEMVMVDILGLEAKMEDSPAPTLPDDVAICGTNWEDELSLEDIRKGLRIVFTSPTVKASGKMAKVWEQVLFNLVEAANKRIDCLTSRLAVDRSSMSVLELMREVMDYGSALSARIRVVQRELSQLLAFTSDATLSNADGEMTITTLLTSRDATKTCLQCSIATKAYDLLQKGSYARAATDICVRALQDDYDELAHAITATITSSKEHASIYDLIANACACNGHQLYH
ncbi:hypothetical protein X943_001037 [Babesia divergens]|uniref:Uncharacterized protein n=1 Tax=Babesia divergens TaxID=32595 RepID=A0AAD9GF78_BABDI|nr:hypothetical protein X943_001037 [Babesia divergens]